MPLSYLLLLFLVTHFCLVFLHSQVLTVHHTEHTCHAIHVKITIATIRVSHLNESFLPPSWRPAKCFHSVKTVRHSYPCGDIWSPLTYKNAAVPHPFHTHAINTPKTVETWGFEPALSTAAILRMLHYEVNVALAASLNRIIHTIT